jgi:hypothetical protein
MRCFPGVGAGSKDISIDSLDLHGEFSPQSCREAADKYSMSTSAIGNLSSTYLQQVLVSALQSAGITANSSSYTSDTTSSSQSDSAQLSPFAQLASTLQQLQATDPAEYKQVTQEIATNLQSAAQTAQSQGNSSAASQLTKLSSDFTSASQTSQLPNLQDLSQAVGGHHQSPSTDPGTIIQQTLATAGIVAG